MNVDMTVVDTIQIDFIMFLPNFKIMLIFCKLSNPIQKPKRNTCLHVYLNDWDGWYVCLYVAISYDSDACLVEWVLATTHENCCQMYREFWRSLANTCSAEYANRHPYAYIFFSLNMFVELFYSYSKFYRYILFDKNSKIKRKNY